MNNLMRKFPSGSFYERQTRFTINYSQEIMDSMIQLRVDEYLVCVLSSLKSTDEGKHHWSFQFVCAA